MTHDREIVKHYSSENKEDSISHMRNPVFLFWLLIVDEVRTFFVSLSEEIADTIAAMQGVMTDGLFVSHIFRRI